MSAAALARIVDGMVGWAMRVEGVQLYRFGINVCYVGAEALEERLVIPEELSGSITRRYLLV